MGMRPQDAETPLRQRVRLWLALCLTLMFATRLFQEWVEGVLVKPSRGFRHRRHAGKFIRRLGRREVPQHARFPQRRIAIFHGLHGKEPFMHHVAKSVYNPCAIEVEPGWLIVLERVETSLARSTAGGQIVVPPGFRGQGNRSRIVILELANIFRHC